MPAKENNQGKPSRTKLNPSQTKLNARKCKELTLHFLAFPLANRDFSMGYAGLRASSGFFRNAHF
jgi:hypothetical protein